MSLSSMTNGLNNTASVHSRALLQCFIANQDALKGFFCKAVSERADADDLFQKLLLKALNSEHLDPIDNPLAYGYRMAQHLVIDHHRQQSKSPETLEHEPHCEALSLESALEYEQRIALYQQILLQMPALRRDVFIRRRIKGQTRAEIASSVGLSEEAVKKHISRAMEMLKNAMAEHFLVHECPR